jgi:hypothetical protein
MFSNTVTQSAISIDPESLEERFQMARPTLRSYVNWLGIDYESLNTDIGQKALKDCYFQRASCLPSDQPIDKSTKISDYKRADLLASNVGSRYYNLVTLEFAPYCVQHHEMDYLKINQTQSPVMFLANTKELLFRAACVENLFSDNVSPTIKNQIIRELSEWKKEKVNKTNKSEYHSMWLSECEIVRDQKAAINARISTLRLEIMNLKIELAQMKAPVYKP